MTRQSLTPGMTRVSELEPDVADPTRLDATRIPFLGLINGTEMISGFLIQFVGHFRYFQRVSGRIFSLQRKLSGLQRKLTA